MSAFEKVRLFIPLLNCINERFWPCHPARVVAGTPCWATVVGAVLAVVFVAPLTVVAKTVVVDIGALPLLFKSRTAPIATIITTTTAAPIIIELVAIKVTRDYFISKVI
jgi:hypothetical protein